MESNLDLFYDVMLKENIHYNKDILMFVLDNLFQEFDFKDKNVLDIGGGSGLYSLYAAFKGAKKVVCIEPESEGSRSGVQEKFSKLQNILGLSNVTLIPITFQLYESENESFDLILLHNSINHLNETACINLLINAESKVIYQSILSKLFRLSRKNAKLIICDCSRYNYYHWLNIRNPYAETIEWHKHQKPEVWVIMLRLAGFTNPKIRWKSLDKWKNIGKFLTGNKWMSYFIHSHFCISMVKPGMVVKQKPQQEPD